MKRSAGINGMRLNLCAVMLTLLITAGMLSAPALPGTDKAHAVPAQEILLSGYADKADLRTAWGTVTEVNSSGEAVMADPNNPTYQNIRFGTYNGAAPVDHWVVGTEDGGDTLMLYQSVSVISMAFNSSTAAHSPAGAFSYAAEASHFGMSDIRAYLNRGLGTPGSEGTKTGLLDTSGVTARSGFERDYYHAAESARLIPFGMTTAEPSQADYTTVDRFSLPSGNYFPYDKVISFGMQDTAITANITTENPRNFIPNSFWTYGGSGYSWLRSRYSNINAMTIQSGNNWTLDANVTGSHGIAAISKIDISDALFAAVHAGHGQPMSLRYRAKGALAGAYLVHDSVSGKAGYAGVPANTRLSILTPSAYTSTLLTSASGSVTVAAGARVWLEQDGTGSDSGLLFAKSPEEGGIVNFDESSKYYTLKDLNGKTLKNPIITKIGEYISFKVEPKPGYEEYVFTPYANGLKCNYSQGNNSFTVKDPFTNITVDVDVVRIQRDYDVTFPSGAGYGVTDTAGSALPNKLTVAEGTQLGFRINLDSSYSNSAVKVYANGAEITPADGVYLLFVNGDTAVTVEGVGKNVYTVMIPSGAAYTVTDTAGREISGIQHALIGSDYTFVVIPKTGYGAVTVRSNGAVLAPIGGVTVGSAFEIKNITQAQTVTITSEGQQRYNITIPSGAGYTMTDGAGSIIAGTQTVTHNGDFLFRADAAAGYEVTEVRVNGGLVYAEGGMYALRSITEDKGITVAVRKKQYTLTFPAGEGYSVTDALGANSSGKRTVTHGDSYKFKVPIIAGYDGSGLEVYSNGERISADTEGFYTLRDITGDRAVTIAGVKIKTYTVTFVTGTGYSYSDYSGAVLSTVTVAHGGSYTFNIVKGAAYSNDADYTVNADGQKLTGTGMFVLNNVTKNITVTVTGVDLNKYRVQYDPAGGEGDYPDKTVTHGESITLAGAPKREGYEFKGWSIGGNVYSQGSGTTVTGDIMIRAVWAEEESGSMPILTISLITVGALAAVVIIILVIRAIRKNKRNNAAE